MARRFWHAGRKFWRIDALRFRTLFIFFFFDAGEIYNRGCKAYAIMCECDALAFRGGSSSA